MGILSTAPAGSAPTLGNTWPGISDQLSEGRTGRCREGSRERASLSLLPPSLPLCAALVYMSPKVCSVVSTCFPNRMETGVPVISPLRWLPDLGRPELIPCRSSTGRTLSCHCSPVSPFFLPTILGGHAPCQWLRDPPSRPGRKTERTGLRGTEADQNWQSQLFILSQAHSQPSFSQSRALGPTSSLL